MYNYKDRPDMTESVAHWIDHNLSNYLKKHGEDISANEHIIDYLLSDQAPKRIDRMSYEEARSNAAKWTASLIKKASGIQETSEDIETFLDFGDGFKIVQLKGRNAFEREGNLMRHCVASYYDNNDCLVYSLRDPNNKPHCTMEVSLEDSDEKEISQIKGKGNGAIHPKYINYILIFLKKLDYSVEDHEMKNLGYIPVTKFERDILDKNLDGLNYLEHGDMTYLYIHSKHTKKENVNI